MEIYKVKVRYLEKREKLLILTVVFTMVVYFFISHPQLADDGFHYEGFTESLARGVIDFKSYYGFMGLSVLSVPAFWLTGSHLSIVYTSMLLVLLSVPLIYLIARDIFNSKQAGTWGLIIFLLTPYPYTTLMRGFQEGALFFFVLLIVYASIHKKAWTPLVWAFGGLVKPFALTLLPLFAKSLLPIRRTDDGKTVDNRHDVSVSVIRKRITWLIISLAIGLVYLSASYYQVGYLVNNAAINSYQGNFDTGNPPPLVESFTVGIKGPLRIGANLLLAYRKIMVSPFLVIIGLWMLWKNKTFKYRGVFIYSIVLNFLLLSFMTFSFSKYLLPATTLISLAAIPFIVKHKWAMTVFLADSITIFLPIWNFFGKNYWSNIWVYLAPFWLATILTILSMIENQNLKHKF